VFSYRLGMESSFYEKNLKCYTRAQKVVTSCCNIRATDFNILSGGFQRLFGGWLRYFEFWNPKGRDLWRDLRPNWRDASLGLCGFPSPIKEGCKGGKRGSILPLKNQEPAVRTRRPDLKKKRNSKLERAFALSSKMYCKNNPSMRFSFPSMN